MCTGLTLITQNHNVLFARTMDFVHHLEGQPAISPRRHYWKSRVDYQGETLYGFMGTGCQMDGFIFGDGVNEHGLAASNQYFRGNSSYATEVVEGAINIAPSEVLNWVLGYNKDIAELETNADQVNVVAYKLDDLGEVPPLHYHIADATGRSVELMFVEGALKINDNPVGVLTNNPSLEWHYENLRNYSHLKPSKPEPNTFGNQTFDVHGNEGGTQGLPGGFSSPERFVRAAYLKHNLVTDMPESATFWSAFKILDAVSIPRGAVRPDGEEIHYTMYQTVINLTTRTLYCKHYYSNQIVELEMNEDLLEADEMTFYQPVEYVNTVKING